jgi:hypothetical protein
MRKQESPFLWTGLEKLGFAAQMLPQSDQASQQKGIFVMLVAKVHMNGNWCVFNPPVSALDDVRDFLTDSGKGEDCNIVICEMTQDEIDALPEFTGW